MTAPRGEPWLVAAFFLGVVSLLLLFSSKLLGDPSRRQPGAGTRPARHLCRATAPPGHSRLLP